LPGIQDKCVAQCTGEIGGIDISDDCVACITSHTNRCSTIEIDCENVCDTRQPPTDGGGSGSGSGSFPDAAIVIVDSF
jgi:hypothetical protein